LGDIVVSVSESKLTEFIEFIESTEFIEFIESTEFIEFINFTEFIEFIESTEFIGDVIDIIAGTGIIQGFVFFFGFTEAFLVSICVPVDIVVIIGIWGFIDLIEFVIIGI
jgi:hypothetical protein